MRSAQSRLGVISSLGAAGRGVGRCVQAVPVSARAIKVGATAVAGLAGVALLRTLLPSRRSRAALPTPVPVPQKSRRIGLGHILLTEAVVTLLLPLCRHYMLGEKNPVADRIAPVIDRFMHKRRTGAPQ